LSSGIENYLAGNALILFSVWKIGLTLTPKKSFMSEDFIPTSSGSKMYYMEPEPGQIELEDLAHGLAMNPRFGGQTTEFYSVAKHSILVSR